MFERFTDRARRVVVLAQEEARMLNHNYIGTEHILLGLIHEGEGVAAKALESLGISLEAVRNQVEEIIGQGQQAPSGHIPFTPRAKKVLELSLRDEMDYTPRCVLTTVKAKFRDFLRRWPAKLVPSAVLVVLMEHVFKRRQVAGPAAANLPEHSQRQRVVFPSNAHPVVVEALEIEDSFSGPEKLVPVHVPSRCRIDGRNERAVLLCSPDEAVCHSARCIR